MNHVNVERRSAPRVRCALEASSYLGNGHFRCRVIDLSIGGLRLVTLQSPPAGTFLRLHLAVPDSSEIVDVDAFVTRRERIAGREEWGVAFYAPSREAWNMLVPLIHALRHQSAWRHRRGASGARVGPFPPPDPGRRPSTETLKERPLVTNPHVAVPWPSSPRDRASAHAGYPSVANPNASSPDLWSDLAALEAAKLRDLCRKAVKALEE